MGRCQTKLPTSLPEQGFSQGFNKAASLACSTGLLPRFWKDKISPAKNPSLGKLVTNGVHINNNFQKNGKQFLKKI